MSGAKVLSGGVEIVELGGTDKGATIFAGGSQIIG